MKKYLVSYSVDGFQEKPYIIQKKENFVSYILFLSMVKGKTISHLTIKTI